MRSDVTSGVALVETLKHSDEDAQYVLYERYAGRVYLAAYYILGDTITAEEVWQDAFLRLWNKPGYANSRHGRVLGLL